MGGLGLAHDEARAGFTLGDYSSYSFSAQRLHKLSLMRLTRIRAYREAGQGAYAVWYLHELATGSARMYDLSCCVLIELTPYGGS